MLNYVSKKYIFFFFHPKQSDNAAKTKEATENERE